jgi:hypothetical protein
LVLSDKLEIEKQVGSLLCLRLTRVKEILESLQPHPFPLSFISHPTGEEQLAQAMTNSNRALSSVVKKHFEVNRENESVIAFSNEPNGSGGGSTNAKSSVIVEETNGAPKSTTGGHVSDQNLSLDQMWIISSLMQQYLVPEKK